MLHTRPRNTSVYLGEHFAGFINKQVQAGRYGSASDVVRAGLRLLEDHETRVRALEAALLEGEHSGEPRPFDFDAFKVRKRAEHERG
ncbi:MAG: type II toxin-antitoxin system ParD family antitoxin [Azoarcus sp.]|jgi:antitoxin ParD1/3/4|nr:type II toxin-antitoxin system ParD family antitoxin [Azoarcus sp.]